MIEEVKTLKFPDVNRIHCFRLAEPKKLKGFSHLLKMVNVIFLLIGLASVTSLFDSFAQQTQRRYESEIFHCFSSIDECLHPASLGPVTPALS